jgi:hypothetical protein
MYIVTGSITARNKRQKKPRLEAAAAKAAEAEAEAARSFAGETAWEGRRGGGVRENGKKEERTEGGTDSKREEREDGSDIGLTYKRRPLHTISLFDKL